MKRLIFGICVWMAGWSGFSQQTDDLQIAANFQKTAFVDFANSLQTQHVRFYYQPEWVSDIYITATGDSVSLRALLESTFSGKKPGFFINNQRQVFITPGKNTIQTEGFQVIAPPVAISERNGTDRQMEYFGRHNYEKKVTKVILGSDQPSPANQKVYISGRITNKANGEPIVGATIVVPGEPNGAITDAEGSYSIPLMAGRSYNLQVSCLGMEGVLFLADITGSGLLNIEMESKLIDVREVVVKSGKNHNVRGMQMGFQKICVKEIKSIPVVMGERDIFKVATLMPGVQTVGEGSAGFNVRGSASDQNLFLLNGIPVLNTGHMFGFFSAFNPDMVSDFNLYKSNFPVEFGGRLASVFEISTRKGNKKEFGARGSISPVTASLLLETPIVKDKSSFIISTRSTYSDWILDRLEDAEVYGRQAGFYDLMTGVHFVGKNNSSTQIFGYYSKDHFKLSTTNSYRYENLGASVNYDRPIRGKWNMKVAGIFSNYKNYNSNSVEDTRSYQHEFAVSSEELKVNFTGYPLAGHKIGFGTNAVLHHINQGSLLPLSDLSLVEPVFFGKENGLEYAFHVSDEISLTDQLSFYGGIRYSLYNYLGPQDMYSYLDNMPMAEENITDTLSYGKGKSIQHYSGPEFRAAFNYIISPSTSLKASYNRMRQYLFMLSNTVAISPTDRWKLVDPYIAPPISDQFSFGLYKNFNNSSIETSAEVYYKTGQHIIEYKDGVDLTFNPNTETLVLQGDQQAYGIELFIKRNTGRFNGWISYTYSRSIIQVDGEHSWDKINMGIPFPANYDKPHALNLVGNFEISRRLSLSGNLVYNSGRPITFPTGYLVINDYPVVNYSLRNEYRIPDYFRVDLSINVEGNLLKRKIAHGSWAFSVYNLTGRRNAYSVYFVNDRGIIKGYQLSIYGEPIFTISYQFKLGNYAVD